MLIMRSHHTRHTRSHHASVLALLTLAVVLIVLAGCGATARASGAGPSDASAHLPHVTITAHDFSFDMPSEIPAGLVHVTFVNQGDEVHQAQFFRLLPGVTAAQFIAALKTGGPASTRAYSVPTGGVDETAPGLTADVINEFPAGNYVVACLVVHPGEGPHYALGMTASMTATTSASSVSVSTSLANDGAITLVNMSVLLPSTISKPGLRVYQVINDGPGVHALDILRLAPGKTAQDVQAYLKSPSGPPPFTLLGGMGGLAPTTQGWIITNLHPGSYVAACLVVDPTTHRPHAAMGMLAGFTVP